MPTRGLKKSRKQHNNRRVNNKQQTLGEFYLWTDNELELLLDVMLEYKVN